ncbi:MAG: hypothetical protein HQ494_10300, partial [Rhodospirillales bacterium]|nr:hypothetical protein [Rhodospirillales bacterium]
NATGTAAEFKVVRDALVKSGTPEQVKNLTEGVRAELAPDQRKRFDDLVGPGGEGQRGEKPDPNRVQTKQPEKPKPKIEWNEQPEPRDFRPRKIFRTDGPVKVRASTPTMGPDGVWYGIKWHPLDKDGKRAKVVEKVGNKGREIPAVPIPQKPDEKEFTPPWNNPHGWDVELWIPPQQGSHGNSGGHDLDVFLPKAKQQLKSR